MPARLSKPLQRRIRQLYADGSKKNAIAAALDVSRDSVAKYCEGVDEEVELVATPAVAFTSEEVRRLRALAGVVRVTTCDGAKGCGFVFGYLDMGFRDRKLSTAWYCPACGVQWLMTKD